MKVSNLSCAHLSRFVISVISSQPGKRGISSASPTVIFSESKIELEFSVATFSLFAIASFLEKAINNNKITGKAKRYLTTASLRDLLLVIITILCFNYE